MTDDAEILYGFDMSRFGEGACPGCGTRVPVVELPRGTGADRYSDKRPVTCPACLAAKTPKTTHDPFRIPPAQPEWQSRIPTSSSPGPQSSSPPSPRSPSSSTRSSSRRRKP